MPTKEELKARVSEAIDQRAQEIIGISRHILDKPESGYREEGTARFVGEQLDKLGLPHRDGLALTGIKSWVDAGAPRGNPEDLPELPEFLDGWQLSPLLGPRIPTSHLQGNLSFPPPDPPPIPNTQSPLPLPATHGLSPP